LFDIVKEDYETLSKCLNNLNKQFEDLKTFQIREKIYAIKYYSGGDLKYIAIVLGNKQANSNHPCPLCKCKKLYFAVLDGENSEWSMFDIDKGARTLNGPDRAKGANGYNTDSPLFKFIEVEYYVIDTLHMCLRIPDVLLDIFFDELRKYDNSKGNCEYQNRFLNFVKNSSSTVNKLINIQNNQVKLKSFPKALNLYILKNMQLVQLFPDINKCKEIEKIWREFHDIFTSVEKNILKSDEVKKRKKNWLKDYISIYHKNTVTPYMHIFVQHLHELVEKHGNISNFNCEALEKSNHNNTSYLFRGTKFHDQMTKNDDYITQIKKKRISVLRNKFNSNRVIKKRIRKPSIRKLKVTNLDLNELLKK